MKKTLPHLLSGFFLFCTILLSAQSAEFWVYPESKAVVPQELSLLGQIPASYQQVELHVEGLYQFLADATKENGKNPFSVSLPTPEGNFAEFMLVPTSVVADDVAHLYSIQTFKGYAPNAPQVRIRCDLSSTGFHAVVFIKGDQTYVIEPQSKTSASTHLVYYKSELPKANFPCEVKSHGQLDEYKVNDPSLIETPMQKRTYRLALIADPNYQTQYGGMPYNVQNILNSFASGVNLINEVFERDMGVSYEVVSNEACAEASGIDFTSVTQVHNFIVAELGVNGFDIGHSMVWANTGGAAFKGVVCNNGFKGGGFSGNNSSFVTLYIDYGAHEVGHQMGGDHTFVSQECGTSVNNYRYEPGEGSTIMAYAGVCNAGYQNFSDPYLHSASIAQMHVYMAGTGSTCGQTDNTGNDNAPTANAQNNITIPRETPFVLVGAGSDDDGDPLTFDWQQYDGSGNAQTGPPNCNSTTHPLFRIRLPQEENYRIFPEMGLVLAGNNNGATWEKLPCVARTMNFRMQVRDNNPAWGRTAFDDVVVTVANTGPFNVTAPNGGELWDTDIPQTVTWTVNGTDAHCSEVDILLTTDDGSTFTALGTYPNNGSASVSFPVTYSDNARLLIQCSVGGNFRSASTFFDVSDAVFTLTGTDCNGEPLTPVELANWTFETSIPTTAGPHTPEAGLYSASSEASASHASGGVVYDNPAGNGSSESFSSNNWTAGDYYQAKFTTTDYEQISLSWDQTRSGTGPGSFQLQWSTDGSTFAPLLDYTISAISWSSGSSNSNSTFTANLPAAAADQAMVWVRFVSLETTASAGTNRIDNIVLSGLSNAVPGSSCDDGNPCTINDTWDNDCNCVGVLQDTDGDGICDGEDTCPNVPNSEIRSITIDGDIADFGPAIANGNDGVNYYFSADEDFFYIGVTGVNLNNDNIHFAFQTNDGSTIATNWGVNWDNAPYTYLVSVFESNNICYYPFNDPYGCQQVGNSWSNYAGFSGNPTTEIRVPRSFLGSLGSGSGTVNLSIWTNNNNGDFVWSTYPTSNPTGPANVSWVEFGQQAYPTYLPQEPAEEDECGECILNGESNPLWNASCTDCEGVVNGTALPGTACDDADPCTINDTWDNDCNCAGVPNTSTNTTTEAACGSYTWPVNGQTYTASGTYTEIVGCVTEVLELTITLSTTNTTTESACDTYTWPVNGVTYSASGTYTVVNGCATEILELTIIPSTTNTTTEAACDSYTWPVNGVTYSASGTYTAVNGCATEILELIIIPSTTNTTTEAACDSYFWAVNEQTYTATGTYTFVDGCHTEILELTITPSFTNTTTESACESYTWQVNNQTYFSSGTYTEVVGCVTEILELSIIVPGAACDDGDPNTGDDVYDADCNCVGLLIDCEGIPGGSVLPGTPCDDGDPNTENDQYNNDCECVGTPLGLVSLSGTILWEHDNSGVPDADVDLMLGMSLEANTQSTATGAYSFNVAPDGSSYELVPSKTPAPNQPNCGVTVLDVLLIQQHVTFVNVITDPYKLIAADVNQSNSISTLDALLVAQTLLGNPAAAAIFNQYWRFVDAGYTFPVPASPWGFPETIEVPNVTNAVTGLDFYGIILGDVNGSGNPENACSNPRSGDALVWVVQDQPLEQYGQEIELDFYAEQFQSLSSYQFGLGFSASHLELISIQPGTALPLTEAHFGAHLSEAGELRAIWWDESNHPEGISLRAEEPVFTLRFRVLRQASSLTEHLWIDEAVMQGLAYDSEQTPGSVVLNFEQSLVSDTRIQPRGQLQLFQNVPNPFSLQTSIGFYLPEACQVRLRVFDVTGQLLKLVEGNFSVGYHEVIYQKQEVGAGLLYYQLETPYGTLTRKMITQ